MMDQEGSVRVLYCPRHIMEGLWITTETCQESGTVGRETKFWSPEYHFHDFLDCGSRILIFQWSSFSVKLLEALTYKKNVYLGFLFIFSPILFSVLTTLDENVIPLKPETHLNNI